MLATTHISINFEQSSFEVRNMFKPLHITGALLLIASLTSCTSGGHLTDGLSRETPEATEVFSKRVQETFANGMDQAVFRAQLADLGFVLLADEPIQVSRPLEQGPVARATIFTNLFCTQYALIRWVERDGMIYQIEGWTTSSGC